MHYKDNGAETPHRSICVAPTTRGRKVNELIEKTGIVLVQRDGIGFAALGWHSAWSVRNVKRPPETEFVEFDLGERLA
jgi:hypothetical protein